MQMEVPWPSSIICRSHRPLGLSWFPAKSPLGWSPALWSIFASLPSFCCLPHSSLILLRCTEPGSGQTMEWTAHWGSRQPFFPIGSRNLQLIVQRNHDIFPQQQILCSLSRKGGVIRLAPYCTYLSVQMFTIALMINSSLSAVCHEPFFILPSLLPSLNATLEGLLCVSYVCRAIWPHTV